MKIITKFFLGLLLSTQLATASGSDGLKQAIDEFYFAMTVEWDQSNEDFALRKKQELKENISLLVNNGLTEQDVIAALPNVEVELIKKEILQSSLKTESEITDFIMQNHKRFYKQGASWNGELAYAIGLWLFIVIPVLILLTYEKKECERNNPGMKCDT